MAANTTDKVANRGAAESASGTFVTVPLADGMVTLAGTCGAAESASGTFVSVSLDDGMVTLARTCGAAVETGGTEATSSCMLDCK